MKGIYNKLFPIVFLLFLQSCALYAVYGTLQTINNINNVLNMVCTSMNTIHAIINEGTNLKRAAEDGKLISTLAERIPSLIVEPIEQAVKEKIHMLSDDLKTSAINFTQNALEENLPGAIEAYNRMSDTYNRFSDLMVDLEQTASP